MAGSRRGAHRPPRCPGHFACAQSPVIPRPKCSSCNFIHDRHPGDYCRAIPSTGIGTTGPRHWAHKVSLFIHWLCPSHLFGQHPTTTANLPLSIGPGLLFAQRVSTPATFPFPPDCLLLFIAARPCFVMALALGMCASHGPSRPGYRRRAIRVKGAPKECLPPNGGSRHCHSRPWPAPSGASPSSHCAQSGQHQRGLIGWGRSPFKTKTTVARMFGCLAATNNSQSPPPHYGGVSSKSSTRQRRIGAQKGEEQQQPVGDNTMGTGRRQQQHGGWLIGGTASRSSQLLSTAGKSSPIG